jgi:signal transduction histidine kinase/DNA-binding response OmpR family regulator
MKIKTKLLIGFWSFLAIILSVCILAIAEIRMQYTISENIGIKNASLANAAMMIKLNTTTATLWFEKIIANAENKGRIEKVWELFDKALWYANAMLKGGKDEKATFHAVNDLGIEGRIFRVKVDIEMFVKLAHERFENRVATKGAQPLDDKFDALFNEIITSADRIEAMIRTRIVRDVRKIEKTTTITTLILSIATLFSIIIISIVTYHLSHDIIKQIGGEPAEIAHITEQMAAGNFELCQQSGKTTGIYAAVQVMITNFKTVIEDIVQVSQSLAEGNQNVVPQAEYQGDFAQIKNALTAAADKLADTTAQKNRQDWLKAGQARLNEWMSGEQDIYSLAKNIISFLTTYVEASVGLFYLLQESKQRAKPYLQLVASYAYSASNNMPNEFLVGEGLVGQAALEQQTIFRIHAPEEYAYIIQSGLSQAVPRYVIILPSLYEGTVKNVIEIGTSNMFTEIQGEFLEQVMPSIGIAVNSAESRTQMQVLLEQTRQQAKELQNKQIEIQHTNEKLQNQAEELQSRSEELQTQQEELRQTNETLEERTKNLQRQKTEIQAKNKALEQTKAEMELAQAAIETKARELELSNKYKSEFLANMSHELRTPLNSLLILAQLLMDNKSGNLTDKQVEYVRTIHSSGSDLLTLINEILDLSKVESGKIELRRENILLGDLIAMVEQKFRHVAQDKGLTFSLTIANDMASIMLYTDGQRLKQIINNLLSNAFKFTSEGEIKVMVEHPSDIPTVSQGEDIYEQFPVSSRILEPSKTIAISVTDTGIGIPKDKQQIIFEAFQQVDGTNSRSYGGTGLGLSISRQLARLLGGELTLDSEEGKGSIFTLYLPETESSEILKIETHTKEKTEMLSMLTDENDPLPDDRNDLQTADKSILIIEDDREFSNVLVDLAHSKGFKSLVGENGLTGLQLAEKYRPTAILLDVGLPQLNGWTVLERLKDNSSTRHIPVHFISATNNKSIYARRMGAIGYLLKPVTMEQLGEVFQKIERFLTKTVKNLLVITDVELHQQKIAELVGGEHIQLQVATTTDTVCQQIYHTHTINYDCIILDMDIENGSGSKLLEQMHQKESSCKIPLIAYAERDLSPSEEALLLRCADKLPIKSAQSPERLLDEVTLFLHQIEANLPINKRNMLQIIHDKRAILKHKKVLIIDDDMRNTFALATVLEEFDMEVVVASDGEEGLTVLKEHDDIAIIIMDIMMPEMDGYETMQKIREQPHYKNLPIIALTAKAMKGDKAKCIEAGANDYLAKPVDTDRILSLMRVWLYR